MIFYILTVLLYVIVGSVFGGLLYCLNDWDLIDEGEIPPMPVAALFWPLVLLIALMWVPGEWVYKKCQARKRR
jgi:hypothetical protein